jgi:hypothetical protein
METGGHTITAGNVAALPLVFYGGVNQGVYLPAEGMAISARIDLRIRPTVTAWIERGGAVIAGLNIEIITLTGQAGTDWMQILHAGTQGSGRLVQGIKLPSVEYGIGFLLRQASVVAGDVLRWRVSYGN